MNVCTGELQIANMHINFDCKISLQMLSIVTHYTHFYLQLWYTKTYKKCTIEIGHAKVANCLVHKKIISAIVQWIVTNSNIEYKGLWFYFLWWSGGQLRMMHTIVSMVHTKVFNWKIEIKSSYINEFIQCQ